MWVSSAELLGLMIVWVLLMGLRRRPFFLDLKGHVVPFGHAIAAISTLARVNTACHGS